MRELLFGLLLTGCSIFEAPPDSYSADTGSTGTSSDDPNTTVISTDSGGSDSSDDTGEGFDCSQPVQPVPVANNCVTREIQCGETFVDTTAAGTMAMDDGEYSSWYCTAFPEGDYLGEERIYQFTHPGTGTVTFDLKSPCSELNLIVARWEYWESDGICPTESHSIIECEMDEETGDGSLNVTAISASNYMVIVDGPSPVEDIFELSVTCP